MPIPLSVWPVGPLHTCTTPGCAPAPGSAPCAGRLPDRLWYRIIAAFSRPDDLVLVAEAGTGAAVAACADFDRRLIAHIATRHARTQARARTLAAGHDPHTPTLALFGDSPRTRTAQLAITWPAHTHRRPASLLIVPTPCTTRHPDPAHPGRGLPCHGQPGHALSAHGLSGRGRSAGGRRPPHGASGLTGDAWQRRVIADTVHLLHPGALVVAITAATHPAPGTGAFDDPAGRIITAAREAGLTYLQHIVAIHADLTDGHLTLPETPAGSTEADRSAPGHVATGHAATGRAATGRATVAGTGPRHRRAHLDLLVLTVPGGTHDT